MAKKQLEKDKIVKSPFMTDVIDEVAPTQEQLDQIRLILGVECVFLMTQKKMHSLENCSADGSTCQGHGIMSSAIGFSKSFADNVLNALAYVLETHKNPNA